MEIQKNMFQHVSFSMAVGAAYKEAEHLADSMQEARKLIQERLVKGDGRVLDCLGKASEIQESELLKKYLREITHAVEISSIQNAAEAVEDLQDTVNKAKEIRGSEILNWCMQQLIFLRQVFGFQSVLLLWRNSVNSVINVEK